MQSALLRGADHGVIGEIASIAEGHAAIALSRGGAKKTYPHRDPNEDAAAYAFSDWGALAVVADAHGGCTAAEVAVRRILAFHAPRWLAPAPIGLDARFASEAPEVAADLNAAILQAATGTPGDASRTTLALALVRPRDGWIAALGVGDSHVFRAEVAASRASELAPAAGARATLFLGDPTLSRERLAEGARVEALPLAGDALVLATDGLSESGIGVGDPAATVARSVQQAGTRPRGLRPLATARGLLEHALAAHRSNRSGDNAAAAVLWLD